MTWQSSKENTQVAIIQHQSSHLKDVESCKAAPIEIHFLWGMWMLSMLPARVNIYWCGWCSRSTQKHSLHEKSIWSNKTQRMHMSYIHRIYITGVASILDCMGTVYGRHAESICFELLKRKRGLIMDQWDSTQCLQLFKAISLTQATGWR